jgi:diguanylate cyclase (GGDEF)-like protein
VTTPDRARLERGQLEHARLERGRRGLAAAPPPLIWSGGLVVVFTVAALWWFSPAAAGAAGLIALLAAGWRIAVLTRQVRQLAERDLLTGAAGRSYFFDALKAAIERSRKNGEPVCVAVLDCDDFKQLNARLGHAAGDTALGEVADGLAHIAGPTATVGRIWGDAFAILLPGRSLESATSLLRDAQRHLRTRMSAHNLALTFSIGVSCSGGADAAPEQVLADADALMFAVKRRGRNAIAWPGLYDEATLVKQPDPELARQQ